MGDHHMIELLEVSKENNIYAATIQHTIAGELLVLRFGIETGDYSRLKRILEHRPFENTGVAPYRYFFALSHRNDPTNEALVYTSIRVEQLKQHKQFEFLLSRKLMANLFWFNQLTSKEEVLALMVQ